MKKWLGLVAVMTCMGGTCCAAQVPLTMFGVVLQGATRGTLRQTLKSHGLRPIREDARYWFDTYDAHAVLKGASELDVGYVEASGRFAKAEYRFPSFMDTELVQRVVAMVSAKYGPPASRSGDPALGPVRDRWHFAHGMTIVVWRGWPDATTFLDLENPVAVRTMDAEIRAERARQTRRQAIRQGGAF